MLKRNSILKLLLVASALLVSSAQADNSNAALNLARSAKKIAKSAQASAQLALEQNLTVQDALQAQLAQGGFINFSSCYRAIKTSQLNPTNTVSFACYNLDKEVMINSGYEIGSQLAIVARMRPLLSDGPDGYPIGAEITSQSVDPLKDHSLGVFVVCCSKK